MKKIILLAIVGCICWLSPAFADTGVICKFEGVSDCIIEVALPEPWASGLDYSNGNMGGYDTAIWMSGSELHDVTLRTVDSPPPSGYCKVVYFCTGEEQLIPIGDKRR